MIDPEKNPPHPLFAEIADLLPESRRQEYWRAVTRLRMFREDDDILQLVLVTGFWTVAAAEVHAKIEATCVKHIEGVTSLTRHMGAALNALVKEQEVRNNMTQEIQDLLSDTHVLLNQVRALKWRWIALLGLATLVLGILIGFFMRHVL